MNELTQLIHSLINYDVCREKSKSLENNRSLAHGQTKKITEARLAYNAGSEMISLRSHVERVFHRVPKHLGCASFLTP